MKIVIFGATGLTGQQLVKQAIAAEHRIVVFARNPSKLDIKSENLTIVKEELSDQDSIEKTIDGADAVISLLGPRRSSDNRPLTQGMQNIIKAMKMKDVRRLVSSSTLRVKDPADKPSFNVKLLVGIIKTTIHAAYDDIIGVADEVRGSDLDWTIVRVAMLNNKPKTGTVRTGYVGTGQVGLSISHADFADFMLKQVEDRRFLRQAPAISN